MLWYPIKKKEDCELKRVKVHLKIDLLSHPAYVEILVNMC